MGVIISRSASDTMQECKFSLWFGSAKSTFFINFLKSSESTGFGQEHKRKDGKKNYKFYNIKCNGQPRPSYTRPKNGRLGIKSQTSIQAQKLMQLGRHLNGGIWHWMQIGNSE